MIIIKYEYGYAIFGNGRILIETYKDGVLYEIEYSNIESLEQEKIALDMEGYIYSEECTKKVQRRIKKCENRFNN